MPQTKHVLFVCTGNICRSPTAEGVFKKLVADVGLSHLIRADSAGTHGYHVGKPPDARAQEVARRRGYNLSKLRARRLEATDLDRYDLVLAMDEGHFELLEGLRTPSSRAQVRMMLDYASCPPVPGPGARDVPDPYQGGQDDFVRALELIEDAAAGLLHELRVELGDLPAASSTGTTKF
jgi:protein-tyrosine phosphatase